MTLRHCVREAQNGNHEATLFLLGQFSPLIKKQVKKYNSYINPSKKPSRRLMLRRVDVFLNLT